MNEVEVRSDGRTVWVNSGVSGACVGRFSRFGIDIHNDLEVQMANGGQCLDCTHHHPSLADWQRFRKGMLDFYEVEVEEKHRPRWVKADDTQAP